MYYLAQVYLNIKCWLNYVEAWSNGNDVMCWSNEADKIIVGWEPHGLSWHAGPQGQILLSHDHGPRKHTAQHHKLDVSFIKNNKPPNVLPHYVSSNSSDCSSSIIYPQGGKLTSIFQEKDTKHQQLSLLVLMFSQT